MSSGYTGIEETKKGVTKIRPLKEHEHQVIVITIKGEAPAGATNEWNDFIKYIKPKFGDKMIAVTVDGANTPIKYRGK